MASREKRNVNSGHKKGYPYKSTLRMITRNVMEDASRQSIHHNARRTVNSGEDIKKKRRKGQSPF
jgi:hypothetical protein